MTEKELLARMDERLEELTRQFKNHLKHHAAITIAALAAVFASAGTLVIALILKAI